MSSTTDNSNTTSSGEEKMIIKHENVNKGIIEFDAVDWQSRDSMVDLFPRFFREQYAHKKANKKNVSKAVHIDPFTMKTPFGDRFLLKDTELILEPSKRQCLFGQNATGKTLLFSKMANCEIKDFPTHLHIHHCKELEGDELNETVLNAVVNSHPLRPVLVKCEDKLKALIADLDKEKDKVLIGKYKDNLEWVQFNMRSINGYEAEDRAAKMLRVLGFDDIGQKKLVSSCSGGLRMRVALCMAFFIEADYLLLDEPTNHLDFPSVLWLENRLRGYKGSFLMVSHDRELLNNVCTSVLLIEDQQIKYYSMGFKLFETTKAKEDAKKYEEIEKFLKKNQNVDPSTPLGRQKYDKKKWSDEYNAKQVALAGKFTFPSSVALENTEKGEDGKPIAPENISIINLKDVRFSYDEKTGHFIFNDPISFKVTASTRVGVMGPNGAGKSTLLKLLTHKLTPTSGTVTDHPKFTLAYFGQHSTAELDLELTAAEFMQRSFPDQKAGLLRNHLAKTGVVGTVQDTRIKGLSYSQRSCIIFSKLTYVCPHLLIMDEPTNFLDLESVDSLISACNKYKGALLLVSHNRDFLKKCARQYLSVVPGQFKLFNELKEAERSTYTFIQEMEEGSKVGASALAKNPGGGTVHSSQKVEKKDEKKTDEKKTDTTEKKSDSKEIKSTTEKKVTITPTTTNTTKKDTYNVGDKIQALWTDGKWYAATVKKINTQTGKYTVNYTQYGNNADLLIAKLRPVPSK